MTPTTYLDRDPGDEDPLVDLPPITEALRRLLRGADAWIRRHEPPRVVIFYGGLVLRVGWGEP